jgi:hypothetical protein
VNFKSRVQGFAAIVVSVTAGFSVSFSTGNSVARANVDLTGEFVGPVQVVETTAGQPKKLSFQFKVKNLGASDVAAQDLRLKPFVLPNINRAYSDDSADGLVLKVQDVVGFTVPAGGEAVVQYEQELPLMPLNNYLLAVIVNSNRKIEEMLPPLNFPAIKNNVVGLVDIGSVENGISPVLSGDFDFYSEMSGPFRVMNGGVSHSLRTIVRGPTEQYPRYEIEGRRDEDLWASFMLADIANKTVAVLPYRSEDSDWDKAWYAIGYWDEADLRGERIHVDYYSQAPLIAGIAPGSYKFLTLMNLKDQVTGEIDPYNNLDVKPVDIKALHLQGGRSEVWLVNQVGQPENVQTLNLRNPYRLSSTATLQWQATEVPAGLAADPAAGSTVGRRDSFTVNLKSATVATNASETSGDLKLVSSLWPNAPVAIAVKHFVLPAGQAPVATLSVAALAFEVTQKDFAQTKPLVLRNDGNLPLQFRLDAADEWLQATPSSGVVEPGASVEVQVGVNPHGLQQFEHSSSLLVQTNAKNDHTAIPVEINVKDAIPETP